MRKVEEYIIMHSSFGIAKFVGLFATPPPSVEEARKDLNSDLAKLQDTFTDKAEHYYIAMLTLVAARCTAMLIALYHADDPKSIADIRAVDYPHIATDEMAAYLRNFLDASDWDPFDEQK